MSSNGIKKEDISIAYVAIINCKDTPILLKNYDYSQNEELNFQMNIFATLDLIENRVTKKLLISENKNPVSSFLSCVNSVYFAEDEFDIYGYVTVGKLKILTILHQKSMANYDERHIQTFMSKVYAAYMKDIMNPFIPSIDDHKLTDKFHARLDSIVSEYQVILKKSV